MQAQVTVLLISCDPTSRLEGAWLRVQQMNAARDEDDFAFSVAAATRHHGGELMPLTCPPPLHLLAFTNGFCCSITEQFQVLDHALSAEAVSHGAGAG